MSDFVAACWPPPADPDAAARLRGDLTDCADWGVALDALGGNAPYLADLARRETVTFRAVMAQGPDAVLREVLDGLGTQDPAQPTSRIASLLRQAKRRAALCIALADLGGAWQLEQVTAALSDLADGALRLACDHLLLAAHNAGKLRLPDPANPSRGSGFAVLGMGKLGAQELNYSSDVDLILIHESWATPVPDDAVDIFSRIARGLIGLMATRDADGYVFRTDLRLRPNASSSPPSIGLDAALIYYESMGQTWERAAFIKARPVAGDCDLGQQFLEAIRPFVWRRHLDFAAIADIGAMKARIDAHKGSALPERDAPEGLAGFDLKLGQGGIREIEFIAQTLQMVWGGREPGLRSPATLPALAALARAGRLPEAAVPDLEDAYRALRQAEHRLQMVADRQTHSLPDSAEGLRRIAPFLGLGDGAALAAHLLPRLRRVHARFDGLLSSGVRSEARPEMTDATLQAHLRELGFHAVGNVARAIERWRAGYPRATRSERARELLREVLPVLLAALARQPEPDLVFTRFDAFLSRLPAGVQLLSLFQRNPALLDRVAMVLGAAPVLSEHLAREPAALEGLLAAATEHPAALSPWRMLTAQLRDAGGLEDAIALLRRFVRGEEFRLSLALLERRIDPDAAGVARTTLAEATIGFLLPRVLAEHARRNGVVPGGGMAVVAMGKAGSREMLPGSDLDLMLIYDHPEDVTESTGGGRSLPVSTWFVRAAHSFVAALTAPGADGPLYAIDMRLRPSGNKGPVAVSLASFVRYHAEDAWTWERMALTRARVIAGPSALRRQVRAAIRDTLRHAGPVEKIRADAAAMRGRIARDLPAASGWDVKLRAGGLMDVEFIAQALQLVAAPKHATACDPTTHVALRRLAEAGLLPAEDADTLVRAHRIWRGVQGVLRLTVHDPGPDSLSAPLLRTLAYAAEAAHDLDEAALVATLDAVAHTVRGLFIRHIGEPEGDESSAGR
jgi:[glutamine synthetase] adenylyltransferase / [glutamine synthetase]-adenylyl-L-tyrosine phosphorylase